MFLPKCQSGSGHKIWLELKDCLALATPLAGAQLAQAATAFVDTVMMGLLGGSVLAAGGLGATLFQILVIISTNVISAVSPLVASAYGAGQQTTVGKILRQGFWLVAGLALPLGLLLWYAAPLLRMLGQDPAIIAIALPYIRAVVWGLPALLGFAVLRNLVSALSDPRPIIVITLAGTLCNVLGNYLLMFGKFGLPKLGLAGIGWASAISLWGMFAALMLYLFSQPRYRPYHLLGQLWPDLDLLGELLQIGLPIGVLAAVETGMFALTTVLMGQIGAVPLAAHQIVLQTASITFMVPLGISFATTIRVGQQLGQQNRRGARRAGVVGIAISALFMSLTALLVWLFPAPIIGLYVDLGNPANADLVQLARQLLVIAAVFQIADGVQVSAAGALRGLPDTRVPLLIGLLAYWGVGLSSSYWLGIRLGWGGVGLWWGLALGLLMAAVVLTLRFLTIPILAAKSSS
ncbi:MAG: MATE family efflux transporter [Pegethrix bostrychoides GSE-TBD4-15B]|jgi:MATE family multidrug resistance protein|uniref:Probable multidrug resistance protein NorM n=1 Tax=Pegethrix bostrychoides GSE-TBD4-15B TaxID=2839662 RepID=A0A951U5U6_9CYAN|nr:MATE family efflux transporter [Pegethrix bostrychoides GSE-TBD4-15B]